MGNAHSHARITKRMASHKAGMRASCDSIEMKLCPYRFLFCFWKMPQGRCPRTPTNFLKKVRSKTFVCVVGRLNERSDLRESETFDVSLNRQHEPLRSIPRFGEWAKPILMPASPKGWRRTKQVCGPRAIAPKQLCCPFGFCFVWFDCWDVVPSPTKGAAFGNRKLLCTKV